MTGENAPSQLGNPDPLANPGRHKAKCSIEDRVAIQLYRALKREFRDRSVDEQSFFCIFRVLAGERGSELPSAIEFTARGITKTVTTRWETKAHRTS